MGTDPPLPAKNLIELTCWDCAATWTIQRRRGQYPRTCARCRADRPAAQRIAALLERGGADAVVDLHEKHGWCAMLRTPWHNERVAVLDEDDARAALHELAGNARREAA